MNVKDLQIIDNQIKLELLDGLIEIAFEKNNDLQIFKNLIDQALEEGKMLYLICKITILIFFQFIFLRYSN